MVRRESISLRWIGAKALPTSTEPSKTDIRRQGPRDKGWERCSAWPPCFRSILTPITEQRFLHVFSEIPAWRPQASAVLQGAITVAVAGESVCGDAWSSRLTPEGSVYIVADGLGHGPLASDAAREAVRVFEEASDGPPERILREIHGALAKTRGAAVSIAEILYDRGSVNYAGAGNIAAAVWSNGKSRSTVSMNGTVGHSVAKIQSFSYPWEPNSLLIMHSDGLGSNGLDQYPGLAQRHPALIAAVLYRDFSRKRDDATIVVSRRQ